MLAPRDSTVYILTFENPLYESTTYCSRFCSHYFSQPLHCSHGSIDEHYTEIQLQKPQQPGTSFSIKLKMKYKKRIGKKINSKKKKV